MPASTGTPPGSSPGRGLAADWCPVCGVSLKQLEQWIEWLERKQERERAYLERRARRGVRTPTDEVYEADQRELEGLLVVLRQGLARARSQGHTSQMSSLVAYPDEW
jgi:hypothetical protein